MKTPFLVASLLSQLLTTSLSAKHLLIETVDEKDESVAATPVEKSNKAGSDYMGCGFFWLAECPDVEEKLPTDGDGGGNATMLRMADGDGDATMLRSLDRHICGGNSRHGAPCTT